MAGRSSGLLCGRPSRDRATPCRPRSDITPLEDLPPELRSRVRAAAAQAANVEAVPEGAGYRICAVSGDAALGMYLELRPDGSVAERTLVRHQAPEVGAEKPQAMNLEELSDEELVDRLRTALADVVILEADPVGLLEAWQRVVEGVRDLERRYPPQSPELA